MNEIIEVVSIAAPLSAAVGVAACMCYCIIAGRVRALTSRVQQLETVRMHQAHPIPAHSYIRMPYSDNPTVPTAPSGMIW